MTDILDRIKKLYALGTKNTNEHEMARAMELANKLMMEHGITEDQLRDKPATIKKGVNIEMEYRWWYDCAIAAGILYGCKVIRWTHKDWKNPRFSFTGRLDNIDAAQLTTTFLIMQIEALYKAALPKGMSKTERAEYRRTFKGACARRVWNRAWFIAHPPQPTGKALMIIDHREQLKAEADEFHKDQKIPIIEPKPTKFGKGTIDGIQAGDMVDLNQKVAAQ